MLELVKNSLHEKVTDAYGSPPLPKNCVFYGVVERHSQSPTVLVAIERDKCIRPYNHFGEIIEVGYPKLVFLYAIKGNKVCGSYVAAVTDEIIKSESPVYFFPYGNVGLTHSICMGNYFHPEVKELSDVTYFPEPFYLIEHTHPNNAKNQVIKELLEQTKGKPFNDELLIFNCTFKDFINKTH
ncbi:hypothetical protein ACOBQJ_03735 [Pelotomaculum propionicicum]|uniref:hypothetical protein n=1 Tax=Pelotomaculum propionicicum TaxID=258475 RepID=UPI003B7B7DB6